MSDKKTTNVNTDFGFGSELFKTLLQQPDFKGAGGHAPETHGGHGLHGQMSVGLGDRTVNIRVPPPPPVY